MAENSNEKWCLYIDDIRHPHIEYRHSNWENIFTVARTVEEAILLVEKNGLPERMSLDHDLGFNPNIKEYDSVMRFLKWFAGFVIENKITKKQFPAWYAHSANPIGVRNINSFLESLEKTLNDD